MRVVAAAPPHQSSRNPAFFLLQLSSDKRGPAEGTKPAAASQLGRGEPGVRLCFEIRVPRTFIEYFPLHRVTYPFVTHSPFRAMVPHAIQHVPHSSSSRAPLKRQSICV